MNSTLRIFFILIFASVFSCFAQESSFIKMKMKNPDDSGAVKISEISVNGEITGNISTTTVDLIFKNTTDRILEGEFEFPLGENETVSGYALDINGKLRKGVVVEKEKGRQVFESVVRKNVDPGLVEMTAGNNFKTRVYPIPANGFRHVQISYESEVEKNYVLPVLTDELLDKFELNISVPNDPLKKSDGLTAGSFSKFSKSNYRFEKPFVVPVKKVPAYYVQTVGKDTFFYIYNTLDEKNVRQKILPKSLAVYFDVSSSSKKRNVQKEVKLLTEYIKKLQSAQNNLHITLCTFSNTLLEKKVFFANSRIEDMQTFLLNQKFDGATSFSFSDDTKAEEIILISDGIENWQSGAESKNSFFNSSKARIYSINSSAAANHTFLQKIAFENGGDYINLVSKDLSSALSDLCNESYRLINLKFNSEEFSDVYPCNGTIVKDSISVSGILNKKSGKIRANFGYGNKIDKSLEFDVSAFSDAETPVVQRVWAQKKIAFLSLNYEENRSEIIQLAKKHGIVTRDTSLIVLDSVHDYVRYEIVPPDELRAEYDRLISGRPQTKTSLQKSNLNDVFKEFNDYKAWWRRDLNSFKIKNKQFKNISSEENEIDFVFEDVFEVEVVEAPRVVRAASRFASEAENVAPEYELAKSFDQKSFSGAGFNPSEPESADTSSSSRIELQAWSSDADYISILKRTPANGMYGKYLELKTEYEDSPAFYMEVSDYFNEEKMPELSLRILSNLAELNLENSDILRALGNKLIERGDYELAIPVFEKLTKIRSEIPQFYRDLALAYNFAGKKQQAVDTLWLLVSKKWDSRFDKIQQIALNDMNAIIATSKDIDVSTIDSRFIENFDVDVRIVLTWNTDDCDIDLWVTD